MNNTLQLEDRVSRSRSKHEGESSASVCDRLSRTRVSSQRQLPTDHDYAVPTREYQLDQSSPIPATAAADSVLEKTKTEYKRLFADVDRVTPYHLTDSNTDWAQQLKAVKKYVDERGIKDCWFAYFAEPVVDFKDYGIPCKPLPSADTGWFNLQVDTPETVKGTVLISAGTLTGFELGSNVLNPYRNFQKMKPTAVIKHGVFVYDGTFDMRFASALGHVTRAEGLARAKQLDAALVEAQMAVQIDPDQLQAQMALGDRLVAMGRAGEAKPVYEKALTIAKTMEPDVAAEWVPQVEQKIAGK